MDSVTTRRHVQLWLSCGALVLLAGACTHEKQSQPAQSPAETLPAPSAEAARQDGKGGTAIRLSAEIREQCRMPTEPNELPLFDVDQATLRPRGRDILADVANCLKDGPLQNRTITIIGRTDARGTEEHNQNLGANRAEATRNYLQNLGVSEKKLLVISRGEEGASGTDEESMAQDRRVDLVLGDATERTNISQNPPANAAKNTPAANAASTYADQAEGGPSSGR